jgi:predicted PurR-regulated permease PerM
MKQVLTQTLTMLAQAFFLYLIFTLIETEPNPLLWSLASRIIAVILFVLAQGTQNTR